MLAGGGGDPPEMCQVGCEGCSEKYGERCGERCSKKGSAGETVHGERGIPRRRGNLREAACVEELPP
jgi:hypothetical protein